MTLETYYAHAWTSLIGALAYAWTVTILLVLLCVIACCVLRAWWYR